MNLRRIAVSAVAAVGVAALLPLSASAARPNPVPFKAPASPGATVAGTCTLSAPTRVAISKPYLPLPTKVTGTCATSPNSLSGWELTHPSKGPVLDLVFDNTTTDTWEVYSDDPIGIQSFSPLGSWDGADNPLTQNTPTTTVKLAAGAWISSSRTGDVVTLKGTSLLYSVSKNIFFKRSASGVFQYRDKGTTTWKNLKAVTTNSAGEATMAYRYTPTRDYRFALYSTSISWDLASATTTR
jgi:hypothetical protein